MIVLLYLLTAIFHIPVTIQISLENPCSDPNNPTCQGYQEIISREQNDLEPYSAHIVYPRTYKQDAYKKSKSMVKKYKSNTVDNMASNKVLKRKEKQLWGFLAIPFIIAGTEIITVLIDKIGDIVIENKRQKKKEKEDKKKKIVGLGGWDKGPNNLIIT